MCEEKIFFPLGGGTLGKKAFTLSDGGDEASSVRAVNQGLIKCTQAFTIEQMNEIKKIFKWLQSHLK